MNCLFIYSSKYVNLSKNLKIYAKSFGYFLNSTTIDKINELTIQDENCKLYLDKINKIASNPEKKKKFISDNNFDKGKFYGFILFYLNIYDDKQFQSLSKKLKEQKEKIFSLRFWFSTPQFFQMMLIYL